MAEAYSLGNRPASEADPHHSGVSPGYWRNERWGPGAAPRRRSEMAVAGGLDCDLVARGIDEPHAGAGFDAADSRHCNGES